MKSLAQNTMIQNRYLIVQLIGKGGMGEVYLAVDQRLGSAIALKRTFFASDDALGNAFEREARVLARLRHPVLPKVSDHFGENEEQYLVMEHISGDDLAKRIEVTQKPFPLSWVMFWADQLLDALSYLHSHEPPIIHRDIKPQNLKLTDENSIVLLDFGLSKTSTGNTNLASGTGSTGSVVGYTPHYAPMEQIRGIGTSAKSDLYSLSATLYQLMTNQVPADALSRADSMLNGMPDPIEAPSKLNPEVPPAVSDVILKGMEVSQDKRFGTAREMQKALRKAFSEMQNVMSAETVAFNANDVQTNGIETPAIAAFAATEVIDPASVQAISNPVGADYSTPFSQSISQPENEAHTDLNATIAYDSNFSTGGSVRQSDLKTEVFIPGGNSYPPASNEPEPYVPTPETPSEPQDFSPTTDYSNVGLDESYGTSPEESYSPQATVPLIAFEGNGASEGLYSEGSDQPAAFDSGEERREEYAPEAAYAAAAPAAVIPVAKKKGSTGKIVAILGGLFAFFVLVLGAGGGAWYYYNNYYAVAEATPSPEPTVEPTASPEPTLDISIIDTNSNTGDTDSNSNTNSNSLMVDPTPTPRPVPTQEGPDERPDVRPTPGGTRTPRPQPTRTARPTPTKKPGGTGPDILQ